MTRMLGAGAIFLLLGLPAKTPQPFPDHAAFNTRVTVRVTNNNTLDMRVYALNNGRQHRLGNVGSFNTRSFKVPTSVTAGRGELRLLSDPIGSRASHLTQTILVSEGDVVHLRIENNLRMTSFSVSQGN